jgi:uncharacterized protein (TIGR00251 family)
VGFLRVAVKVNACSGRDEVCANEDGSLTVRVKAPAQDNKANIAVMKLLSKRFGKDVRIVSGFSSKRKMVEIQD